MNPFSMQLDVSYQHHEGICILLFFPFYLCFIAQATVTSANLPAAVISDVLINLASMIWDKGSYIITHCHSLFEPTRSIHHTQRHFPWGLSKCVCAAQARPSVWRGKQMLFKDSQLQATGTCLKFKSPNLNPVHFI